MRTSRTVDGWIACPIAEPATVGDIRDRLYEWLGEPDAYRSEERPHVSVFGVRLPAHRVEGFEREFDRFADAVGERHGSVEGYHVYPSVRNPMVVTLDVPFRLDAVASPLADLLAERGGRIGRGPTRPHVTLFKGGVRGEEIQWARLDEDTRRRLRAVCGTDGSAVDPPDPIVNPRFEVSIGQPEIEWD